MSTTKLPTVLCPNCRRAQPDRGQRQTCDYCGVFPMPSFDYELESIFNPNNCNGIPMPPRKLPQRTGDPSLTDLLNKTKV